MPKVHALMLAMYDSDEDLNYVRRIADRFEELNNIPVRTLTPADVGDIKEKLVYPQFARYYGWNFVPEDVEYMIYMDTDLIPVKPLPELPTEDFSAVSDIAVLNEDVKKQWALFKTAQCYFNSGFFIASRKMKPIFEEVLLRQTTAHKAKWPWFHDQTLLNIEVQMALRVGRISVRMLPKEWNHLAIMDLETVKDAYMLHVAGIHVSVKLRFINYILDAFCGRKDENNE